MQRYRSVLIVDDDSIIRSVLQAYFASVGVSKIEEAENGQQALEELENGSKKFDLIVLDLNMPVMDGLQLLKHLKRLDFKGSIIVITGEHGAILNAAEEIAIASNLRLLASILKPLTKRKLDDVTSLESALRPDRSKTEEISPSNIQQIMKDQSIIAHYQPVVDMQTGQVVSVEALARCLDPARGIVAARDIIPAAEKCGFVDELSLMMILKVLGQLNVWRSRGVIINAGINVAADQLIAEGFPDKLATILNEFALEPSDITIEVPEPGICQNLGDAMMSIARLRLQGFCIAIDDYGTGNISADRMKRLPATELKIDQTYVTAAPTDEFARTKIQEAINVAAATNVQLVAKGIETQAQWDLMAACGIHSAQGYLVAKPMAADVFEHWLDEHRDETLVSATSA